MREKHRLVPAKSGCAMGYQEAIVKRLGKSLHGRLDDITQEPLPRRWVELIKQLNEQERDAKSRPR